MEQLCLLRHHILLHKQVLKVIDDELSSVPVGEAAILFIVFPEENHRLFPNRTMHVHVNVNENLSQVLTNI